MKQIYILLTLIVVLMSCKQQNTDESTASTSKPSLDIQGHRGARGLAPENTIPAFIKALEHGVTTLELDVAISKDSQIVVSHEPWFNHLISLQPNGKPITADQEKTFNLYRMTYEEIAKFDVGSLGNPKFPEQVKQKAAKPTLRMVVEAVTKYCTDNGLEPVAFNIETKTEKDGDDQFHPQPKDFVQLLYNEIIALGIEKYTTIQSFDTRTLEVIHQLDSTLTTALLIYHADDENDNIQTSLATLSFKPSIYSCYYKYVNAEMLKYAHSNGIKVIPWTVNEVQDMNRLIELGVDGLITDYPNRIFLIRN
jgi:glycerophosphoryl diester phosphodiesterase